VEAPYEVTVYGRFILQFDCVWPGNAGPKEPRQRSAFVSQWWSRESRSVKWFAIILAAVIGTVVLYKMAYPSVTLRYRLTLEAEVDGQTKTGSGVIEASYQKHMSLGAVGRDVAAGFRGEAVALDLGSRGTLFALLKAGSDSRSGPESIVLNTFGLPGGAFPGWDAESLGKLRSLSGKRELPLENLPMLVRFRDVNDPMTVEAVNPSNIAERFGSGARLVRATLEIVPAGIWPLNSFGITGEPLTTGIQERLNWLRRLNGGYLDGGFTSRNAPLGLYGWDFERE